MADRDGPGGCGGSVAAGGRPPAGQQARCGKYHLYAFMLDLAARIEAFVFFQCQGHMCVFSRVAFYLSRFYTSRRRCHLVQTAAFPPEHPLNQPLDGVRILDMSSVVMGPFATQLPGDLGADINNVESPDGDICAMSRGCGIWQ